MAYAALGQRDSAFYWLEHADWNVRSSIFWPEDPQLASLRSDARFPALLRRMGPR
jgi:hypothetical protein